MNKTEIMNFLKKQCEEKLNNSKKLNQQENIKKFSTIRDILKIDNSLIRLKTETALNVLFDILGSKSKSQRIYSLLIAKK